MMVNLLAATPLSRRLARRRLILTSLMIFFCMVVVEGTWWRVALNRLAVRKQEVETLRIGLTGLHEKAFDTTRCRQQYAAMRSLQVFHAGRNQWWENVQKTVAAMPQNLLATRFTQNGSTFQIQGRAGQSSAVSIFVTRLSQTPGFKKVRPGPIKTIDNTSVEFSVTAEVAAAMAEA
ncbi:Fimbrial assembly protein (PilN) [Legionella geestiana]|uniref:Fimbrial assembly protein (PilN) n=1 Tax=Legionella geestiana TaxID=45065 RepID=A0A0W0TVQ5_9GAMM|nr:PilN domain-containing protein [Legionella geestiana]KTC99684.1 Fimbrial assembly protein (PilN) [Legionella geestiana]QBS13193.1 hypothetical protein E4T54_10820 [Legionella geestiana]QDQ39125.1 PilN domain-containing protein [Legionella geestiana]STX54285.1 Fimbrial assembly protein (PilN) [Legionella geestiana]